MRFLNLGIFQDKGREIGRGRIRTDFDVPFSSTYIMHNEYKIKNAKRDGDDLGVFRPSPSS